jgi:hypothetical protein
MRGNLALLVAISQSEALLQQGFNRQGELGGCGGGHLDHLATAPDQVLQAALMRLCKPIETSRSVMHQKTGVVRAQNRRRLRIPTMRLNHPKNGSRPCALNVEVVIMIQHAQRRRGR